jgi:arsenate reductase
MAMVARQSPLVGSALNWQGQPQLQLQLVRLSPRIRHSVKAMAVSFGAGRSIFPLPIEPEAKCSAWHVRWGDSAAGLCEPMVMKLYGIRNCDTVKKARAWLDRRNVAYDFHDYKTAGIDPKRLSAWADELGWERLLNRSGTTFRKLPEADRQDLDRDTAVALMLDQPSMIRRPLLDLGDRRVLGFSDALYEEAVDRR